MKLSHAARILVPLLLGYGCSRHVELYEPSDGGVNVVEGPRPPDDIPEVTDAGVVGEELLACAERPTGDCVGVNDFPCDFQRWVDKTALACVVEVDCVVEGWLGVSMANDGCVDAIEMTHPSTAFVSCLVEQFAQFGCVQCTAQYTTYYLGSVAEPCPVDCEQDEDCPEGSTCEGGTCERDLH